MATVLHLALTALVIPNFVLCEFDSQQLAAAAAASLANGDLRSVDDPAALTASIFTCLIAGFCSVPSPSIQCGLQGGPTNRVTSQIGKCFLDDFPGNPSYQIRGYAAHASRVRARVKIVDNLLSLTSPKVFAA